MLPAMFAMARRYGRDPSVGPLVLIFALGCPLYVFYARAFLIDMMAVMFSVWFAWALLAWIEERGWPLVIVANVAGLGAGLVKITTLMVFAVPLGLYVAGRILTALREGEGRRALTVVRRWAEAAVLPMIGSYAWIKFADSVKALNPSGTELRGEVMHSYHFGTWSQRMQPDLWMDHWRILTTNVLAMPVVVATVAGALVMLTQGRWRWAGAIGMFVLGPAIFPILYSWHEYYFIAVGGFAALALALGVVEVDRLTKHRWIPVVLVVVILIAQGVVYWRNLYPHQWAILPGTEGISALLKESTDPDDVLLIAGNDWAPMLPYACKRRALMFRTHVERNLPVVDQLLTNIADESIGAFIIWGDTSKFDPLREEVTRRFGLHPDPVVSNDDYTVWADRTHRDRIIRAMRKMFYGGVALLPSAAEDYARLDSPIVTVDSLSPELKNAINTLGPAVVAFQGDFPVAVHPFNQRTILGAHPQQRIWLNVDPGSHRLELEFGILPGAYTAVSGKPSDGVGFSLRREKDNGDEVVLWRRLVQPATIESDQGVLSHRMAVELGPGERLVLQTDPGNGANLNYDWAFWQRVSID